jgi:hypothetical protein
MAGIGSCGIIRRFRGRPTLALCLLVSVTAPAFPRLLAPGKIDDLGRKLSRELVQFGPPHASLIDAQIDTV